MRQIKNLMKAKRNAWNCNECKCRTLAAYKCMDEFCWCGDWNTQATPVQPAPAPAPVINDDDNADNNEADYISLDELNS